MAFSAGYGCSPIHHRLVVMDGVCQIGFAIGVLRLGDCAVICCGAYARRRPSANACCALKRGAKRLGRSLMCVEWSVCARGAV